MILQHNTTFVYLRKYKQQSSQYLWLLQNVPSHPLTDHPNTSLTEVQINHNPVLKEELAHRTFAHRSSPGQPGTTGGTTRFSSRFLSELWQQAPSFSLLLTSYLLSNIT